MMQKCPKCGSTKRAVFVSGWVDVDQADLPIGEIRSAIDRSAGVTCRDCGEQYTTPKPRKIQDDTVVILSDTATGTDGWWGTWAEFLAANNFDEAELVADLIARLERDGSAMLGGGSAEEFIVRLASRG